MKTMMKKQLPFNITHRTNFYVRILILHWIPLVKIICTYSIWLRLVVLSIYIIYDEIKIKIAYNKMAAELCGARDARADAGLLTQDLNSWKSARVIAQKWTWTHAASQSETSCVCRTRRAVRYLIKKNRRVKDYAL